MAFMEKKKKVLAVQGRIIPYDTLSHQQQRISRKNSEWGSSGEGKLWPDLSPKQSRVTNKERHTSLPRSFSLIHMQKGYIQQKRRELSAKRRTLCGSPWGNKCMVPPNQGGGTFLVNFPKMSYL